MLDKFKLWSLGLLLTGLAASGTFAQSGYAEGGAEKCLSCHDFGSESPVHAMLAGAHGESSNDQTPMGQSGCEDCHGPSASHTQAPTQVSPGVSFGPRWSSSIADQDSQCLTCHEENVVRHWQDNLHMVNDLTCVTCHDIHQPQDRVLQSASQAEVCTVCHKTQKAGIHSLTDHKGDNPVCTSCHSPHDAETVVGTMLENRSEGCRNCHDLVAMSGQSAVSDKATSYHKVMTQQDRTCLDCHQGIAHNAASGVAPVLTEAVNSRVVSLFYPGQSDSDWLLSEHPGSQPLRQGRNCQQCHRGEEAQMARGITGNATPELRDVEMTFSSDAKSLVLSLSWEGSVDDVDISLMWGDSDSDAFRRGGCFAACHSDMPGMSRDRGQRLGKYLTASRAQQQQIGRPAILKDQAALAQMMAAGNFVEIWRVQLNGGTASVQSAALLSGLDWRDKGPLAGSAKYSDGRWSVRLQRPLAAGVGYKDFTAGDKYTLGVALHGNSNPGGEHWVSLPLTLSLDRDDTDFTTQ